MIILYAWIAIIIGTLILAWLAHEGVFSGPTGCHAREDAPTLGDALAGWLAVLADGIAHWKPLRAASERLRWKIWGLITRSRRVCPANAHGALIWRTRPVREILVDSHCRDDCAYNGACWCGNLRDDDKLRERAAAACASPDGTAPDPASGAVPLKVRVTPSDGFPAVAFRAGKQPWETAGQPKIPDVIA